MYNTRSSLVSLVTLAISLSTLAQTQPRQPGQLNHFELVGNSIVSAQQVFLGTLNKVYIVDKTENNPAQIKGHPAWAAEYDINSNTGRPVDVVTNSFCAGGNVLGNGTWLNVGGNQAVTYGGLQAASQNGGGPYDDPDGGKSLRLLNPCDDQSCDWTFVPGMSTRRWYPTVETLEDGSAIILGGCLNGGYVNDVGQDNPTYEFYPSRGDGAPIPSPILATTLPVNLYPLTWLLPSGKLLIQSNYATVLLDYKSNKETKLDDIPDAVRTYPASAGTIMLPLTPANNYTATVLFCGGNNLQPSQWTQDWNIAAYATSTSCVKITPDVSGKYVHDDPLPEGRSMANLIFLPTGKILCLNGANLGTAGYGNTSWAIGQSFADKPVFTPVLYDPSAPAGKRWSRDGFGASIVPRMYHSVATILPDGSVFVSGSNPNADYTVGEGVTYPTEYRVERFYPSYYNERRPEPQGVPKQLSYGGPSFDIRLSKADLFGNPANVQTATVAILRPGFSTHALNMGQRYLQLTTTYTGNADGSGVLHTSQLPPNPAIIAPGPALIFVIVNGVPSMGQMVMLGSGQLGTQQILAAANLPASNMVANQTNSNSQHKPASSGARMSSGFGLGSLVVSGLFASMVWILS